MRILKVSLLVFVVVLTLRCDNESPTGNSKGQIVSGSSTFEIDYQGVDLSTQSVVALDPTQSAFLDDIAGIDILFKRNALTPGHPNQGDVYLVGSPEGRWSGLNCGRIIVGDCYYSYPDTLQPSVLYLGDVDLSSIVEAPEDGYELLADGVAVGNTFAVITQDHKYCVFRVTSISDTLNVVSIDWMYQGYGDRRFK